ncbi:MAG: TonB-dependent receptor [Bacteroidetes bacterium]|nr:TonB-dependent receptor [Bacteroidota bacterium]
MKKYFLFLAALVGTHLLFAQIDTTTLETAVVTATKFERKQSETGKVLSVIDRATLERNGGKTLGEMLNTVAGVQIIGANNNPGTNNLVTIRGAAAGNTLILLDGIPVNDPSVITNYFDINFIPMDQIERIEILKGGQSTLYGSDAVAGVINIISRKPGEKKIGVNGLFSYGSWETLSQQIGVGGRTRGFNYNIQYAHTNSEGFSSARDSSGTLAFGNNGFDQHVLNSQFQFQLAPGWELQLQHRYSRYQVDLDAAGFTDERDYTSDNYNSQYGIGLSRRHRFGQIRLNYLFNRARRDYLDDSMYKSSPWIDRIESRYVGNTHFIEGYGQWKLKGVELLTGADVRINQTDQWYWSTGPFGPYAPAPLEASMKQLSPYASLLMRKGKWNGELGARVNLHSEYGSNFSFTFNPAYRMNESLRSFVNLYTAFKTPTLYQLFDAFAGNSALQPEQSLVAEAGVEWRKANGLLTRIVGFYRNTEDAIVYTFSPTTFIAAYKNVSRQTNYGVEMELSYQWGKWNLQTNYTYTNGSIRAAYDGTGAPIGKDTSYFNLYRIPKHAWFGELGYRLSKSIFVQTQLRYMGEREEFIYGDKPAILNGYALVDLYGEYKLNDKARLFLDLKNVTDVVYEDIRGYNTRRRNFVVGFRFSLE